MKNTDRLQMIFSILAILANLMGILFLILSIAAYYEVSENKDVNLGHNPPYDSARYPTDFPGDLGNYNAPTSTESKNGVNF